MKEFEEVSRLSNPPTKRKCILLDKASAHSPQLCNFFCHFLSNHPKKSHPQNINECCDTHVDYMRRTIYFIFYLFIYLFYHLHNALFAQDWCEEIFRVPSPPDPEAITYHSTMSPGMNCDFEIEDGCDWRIVPAQNQRKSGETGLVRTRASENNYGRNKDGTYRKKNKGHYLIFQANYRESANMDCSPSYSHIESPWIEQSLPECVLQFNFTGETKDQNGCLWKRQSQLKCFYCSDSRGLPSYKRACIL